MYTFQFQALQIATLLVSLKTGHKEAEWDPLKIQTGVSLTPSENQSLEYRVWIILFLRVLI
jgi:hypothetical protein